MALKGMKPALVHWKYHAHGSVHKGSKAVFANFQENDVKFSTLNQLFSVLGSCYNKYFHTSVFVLL